MGQFTRKLSCLSREYNQIPKLLSLPSELFVIVIVRLRYWVLLIVLEVSWGVLVWTHTENCHCFVEASTTVSVRAYGIQDSLIRESLKRINYYSRPSCLQWNLSRWLNTRLDILGNSFTVSLAGYLVYVNHREASTTGFSLNMSGWSLFKVHFASSNWRFTSLVQFISFVLYSQFQLLSSERYVVQLLDLFIHWTDCPFINSQWVSLATSW